MIRVGLIGVGFIGRNHFNQYARLGERARIVAICDSDPKRRRGDWSEGGGNIGDTAARVQDLGDIRSYERVEEILADGDVDMVDITVPTFLHAEMTIAALRAGKHVLCEKPMALTVKDCDRMIQAARKSRKLLMIAQCIRFWPEYVWLKQAIDDRRYGRLRALSLRRQASTPDWTWDSWALNAKRSGGAILDLHVHDVDYALWVLGKPRSVTAQGWGRRSGIDRVHSLWEYRSGPVVYLEGWWDAPKAFGFNMGFTAVFDRAAVVWDLNTGKPLTIMTSDGRSETPQLAGGDGYYGEIDYFVSCIERGQRPTTSTPRDSRDAVAIALAEARSIRTGKAVAVR